MKYKIKNKTEIYIKYAKIIFAPKEEKVLELDKAYQNENFKIEELGKVEDRKKSKGGK